MLIPFTKMQAQGNDFVILDGFTGLPANFIIQTNFAALAADICKIHTGIGADGLVLLQPSDTADGQMTIYNSDGSRAEMCGSALRCVAWLLQQKLDKTELTIQTDSGQKTASISSDGCISVNLGLPQMFVQDLTALGITGDLVTIGNLHFVVWEKDLNTDPHLLYGSALEHFKGFPQPVNVQFAQVVNENEINLKIWEHACGATLACGTGAACTVFSGILRHKLQNRVKVNMPGGTVHITAKPEGYILSGDVSLSFTGDYLWKT